MDSRAVPTAEQHLADPQTDMLVETTVTTGRLPIVIKHAKSLVPGRKTFVDLSGELRNRVYDLALDKQFQRVPLNRYYLNKPDPFIALLQICSQVYQEARSYLIEKQVAYVPVMAGMQFHYGGELKTDYGLSKGTTDTIAASLTDFMNVHFHLHIDILEQKVSGGGAHCSENLHDVNGKVYNPATLLASLHQAIQQYQQQSWDLYLKHGLKKRHATVHLDHLLSLWPKISCEQPFVPIAAMRDLVNLLAKDTMTDWQIRYYVPTGQANKPVQYGLDDYELSKVIRDADLAQLHSRANTCGHGNITIVAEVYGENTEWVYGDNTGCVVRHRTPATEFWPNMHFDPSRYRFRGGDNVQRSYPEHMPFENFEEDALLATQRDRERRRLWMEELDERDEAAEEKRRQERFEEQAGMERREACLDGFPIL
ncbi:hypothetical protein G6011_03714 [Alternaria panax]|uniref:Uncharacterized protein n=1 Tax=Alternaria panax TaxID=48097 RepID=A0AAD4IFR2_9PLEO|nr:hypothetical protein G6011_03714 [Alternaria panax]